MTLPITPRRFRGTAGARKFNGTSEVINLGTPWQTALVGNPITVTAFVNVTTLPSTSPTYEVIAERGYDGSKEGWTLRFGFDSTPPSFASKLQFNSFDGASGHGANWAHGSNIVTGTWYNVAGTWDGTTWAVWMNGISRATSTDSNGPDLTTARMSIGAADISSAFSRWFPGLIAHVAVYNVALSSTELVALASGVRPDLIRPQSLRGYWPLDGIDSPALDQSIYGDNGVLTGTTFVTGPPLIAQQPRYSLIPFGGPLVSAGAMVFRRTLSPIGTRTGTRQAQLS